MATARQRANNKYNVKAYKQWATRLKPEAHDQVEALRSELGLSKPEFLLELVEKYKK